MRLEICTDKRWRLVVEFGVEHTARAQDCGQQLAGMATSSGMPALARIVDGQGYEVLTCRWGQAWQVPPHAEGYEWVP